MLPGAFVDWNNKASARVNRTADQGTARNKLVEAAGVEPASEIAVSRENPCSVRFRMFSPQALRTDKMRLKLVR